VLLLPGTVFRVGNCGCEKFDRFANGVRFIELLEEPPAIIPGVSPSDRVSRPLPVLRVRTLGAGQAAGWWALMNGWVPTITGVEPWSSV